MHKHAQHTVCDRCISGQVAAADLGVHRLLVATTDVAYLLAVLLRPYMLPSDPVLFSNAAGNPAYYRSTIYY